MTDTPQPPALDPADPEVKRVGGKLVAALRAWNFLPAAPPLDGARIKAIQVGGLPNPQKVEAIRRAVIEPKSTTLSVRQASLLAAHILVDQGLEAADKLGAVGVVKFAGGFKSSKPIAWHAVLSGNEHRVRHALDAHQAHKVAGERGLVAPPEHYDALARALQP